MNTHSATTEQIWELLSGKLKSFLRQRVSDDQVADDLLQETFVRIHQKLGEIDDVERITPWVFQIARNLAIDHYRAKSRTATQMADDLAANDEEPNLNELVAGWLPRMVSHLPDTYREAVQLYELEGISQQEIANRLQLSLSGAKSRVQRGRDVLKAMLFDCCSFEMDRRGNLIGCEPNSRGRDCGGCDCEQSEARE